MTARTTAVQTISKMAIPLIKLKNVPGTKQVYNLATSLIWMLPMDKVVDAEGSKMYLPPHASKQMRVAFYSYILHAKENMTTKLFKQAVKQGDVVVDVGANIGYYTLLAAKLTGNTGRVYPFEPEPTNYKTMVNNVKQNGYTNVFPQNMAVSNKIEMANLYTSRTDIGAHTLRENHEHSQFAKGKGGDYVIVPLTTLDDFFAKRNNKVDVIKMDCEGSELAVILGMERIIKENPKLKMFIEFYPSAIEEMGYSPKELINKLFSYGFKITVIDELRDASNKYIKINSIEDVMSLCKDKEKILNLFAER